MTDATMDHRVNKLVELNETLRDRCRDVRDRYDNARMIKYQGSALVTILQFQESEQHPNHGMLMFVYRYSDETDSYVLECHMEVNYRTVPDNDDRYKFSADEENPEPLKFAGRKIDQFQEVYRDPPELMS